MFPNNIFALFQLSDTFQNGWVDDGWADGVKLGYRILYLAR